MNICLVRKTRVHSFPTRHLNLLVLPPEFLAQIVNELLTHNGRFIWPPMMAFRLSEQIHMPIWLTFARLGLEGTDSLKVSHSRGLAGSRQWDSPLPTVQS